MKKFKWVIVVLVVLVLGVCIYATAKAIVRNSYSYQDYVNSKVDSSIEESEEPPVTLLQEDDSEVEVKEETAQEYSEKKFKEETIDEETNMGIVEELYDTEQVDERQVEFLGDRYETYSLVLSTLEGMYKDAFTKVKPRDTSSTENIVTLSYDIKPKVTLEELEAIDLAIIKDSLTVIGLYDNTYVLFAYNYEDTEGRLLFFVDYTDVKFSSDSNLSSWDFGNVKNLAITPKSTYSEVIDGFTVVFTKG